MTENAVSAPRSPPLSDDLDKDLIQATLHGNEKSFSELIQKYQTQIFVMVHRQLRQREEAEDVVQQVFVKAYQHLKNFRGESKFFTWLYTIALNLTRNHVRQRKKYLATPLDLSDKSDRNSRPQWPDKSPSTEEIVYFRWELKRVMSAFEKLTDPHRAIFALHYFQHLSLKEVAERLGRPATTVKVYLQRARKMVLTQLEIEEKKRVLPSPEKPV